MPSLGNYVKAVDFKRAGRWGWKERKKNWQKKKIPNRKDLVPESAWCKPESRQGTAELASQQFLSQPWASALNSGSMDGEVFKLQSLKPLGRMMQQSQTVLLYRLRGPPGWSWAEISTSFCMQWGRRSQYWGHLCRGSHQHANKEKTYLFLSL